MGVDHSPPLLRERERCHFSLTPWYDPLLLNVQWASQKPPATYLKTKAGVLLRVRAPTADRYLQTKTDQAHENLSKAWHGSEPDLCCFSVPKKAAAGPRQGDGVRGGGKGRPDRAAARQSHLVVPLAQRVAALAAARPLHRPRPDRHGRLR